MSAARPARSLLGGCAAAATAAPRRAPVSLPCLRQFHNSTARSNRKPKFPNVTQEKAEATAATTTTTTTASARPGKDTARGSVKSRFNNTVARDMGLVDHLGRVQPEKMQTYTKQMFPDLTEAEYAEMERKYGKDHVEAIKAGQQAIDPADLAIQGRLRDDMYRPQHRPVPDDYATLHPKIDLKPEVKATRAQEIRWPSPGEHMENFALKVLQDTQKATDDHLTRSMVRALKAVKESKGADMIDLTVEELNDLEKNPDLLAKYLAAEDMPDPAPDAQGSDVMTRAQAEQLDEAIDNAFSQELADLASKTGQGLESPELSVYEDGPGGIERLHSAEAYELGKVPGVEGLYNLKENSEGDDEGVYTEITRLTGLSLPEIKGLVNKTLVYRNVHNQTRLGKVRSSSVLAICGNGNGRAGYAMAKAVDMQVATQTAKLLAIKNMKPIRRYENRTIFGNVKAKISGTVVELSSRPPGFGLRVPWRVFEICRAAGIHDLAFKLPRSKNPMNSVKATFKALWSQPDPEEIAIGRGKKLVDVRKVYYGGNVH